MRGPRLSWPRAGYRIARFVNHEVYGNIEGVLDTILAALERRSTL